MKENQYLRVLFPQQNILMQSNCNLSLHFLLLLRCSMTIFQNLQVIFLSTFHLLVVFIKAIPNIFCYNVLELEPNEQYLCGSNGCVQLFSGDSVIQSTEN